MKRLAIVLVLLAAAALLITGSQAQFVFTERISPPLTEWEIHPAYDSYIGGPITVVFRVYAPAGALVDISNLPEIGEAVDLWRIIPIRPHSSPGSDYDDYYANPDPGYTFNGKFEVQDRVITRTYRGNQQIVEVTYTFLYLDPIDFDHRFTKKVARSWVVSARYFRLDPRRNGVVRDFISTTRQEAIFYLVRRVEEGDQPIFDLMIVRKVVSPLPYLLKLTAVGLVVGMFAAQGWSAVRRRILLRRLRMLPSQPLTSTTAELYAKWQSGGDYRYFLEAIIHYRKGFWGKSRPLDWVRTTFITTFILYSGRVVSASQVKEIFEYLVSLESEKAVEEVQRESVP